MDDAKEERANGRADGRADDKSRRHGVPASGGNPADDARGRGADAG